MDSIKDIKVEYDFECDLWHRYVVYLNGKEIYRTWDVIDAFDYIGNDKRLEKRLKQLAMV